MSSIMDAYLPNLMAPGRDGNISMEAIVGKQPGYEIWTSNGSLKDITPKEIKKLVEDEGALFTSGFTVGGVRCTRIIIVIVITVTINGIVIVIVILIIIMQ